jgi:hypothetical protein
MLAVIEFVLAHWRAALIGVAIASASVFCWKAGYQFKEAREAKAQIALLNKRIEVLNGINAAYNARYSEDQRKLADLKKRANETPPNSAACLDRDASRRVQSIH